MEGQGEHHQEPREYRLLTPQELRESHKQTARIRREWRREQRRRTAREAVAAIKAITFEELVALGLLVGGVVAYSRSGSGWYVALAVVATLRMFWVAREASCAALMFISGLAVHLTHEGWLGLLIGGTAVLKLCWISENSFRS